MFAVSLPKFQQRRRLNRALQMQVQFGLRQKSQQTTRQPIKRGRHHFLIVVSTTQICERLPAKIFYKCKFAVQSAGS
jgi:hypothetical protein